MIYNWNRRIIELFTDFSDVEYQRRSWFGIGPEVSSPIEMYCQIDDLDVESWIEKNREVLSSFTIECIEYFLNAVAKTETKNEPWEAFISDEWISLRLQSSVIKELISADLKNASNGIK